MALLKFGLVLLVVFAVCRALPSSRVDAHNLNVCLNYDRCHLELYQEYVEVKGKLLQYVEHNVVFPNPTSVPSDRDIICIEIQDLDNNGKGGYYTIIGGGLGQRHATINLKSQRSQGLRFNVRLLYNCPQ